MDLVQLLASIGRVGGARLGGIVASEPMGAPCVELEKLDIAQDWGAPAPAQAKQVGAGRPRGFGIYV